MSEKPKNLVVNVNGREVDVSAGGPLKWKEIKQLRQMGIEDAELQKGSPEAVEKFIVFVLNRTDPDIKGEDVDEMSLSDCQLVVKHFALTVEEINRPT